MSNEDRVHMIDVGAKPDTEREATARGIIKMKPSTLKIIQEEGLPKGDVLATAQVAGILAAKNTPQLIPMCHPLLINDIKVVFQLNHETSSIEISTTVKCTGKTGVEMEALTAVAVSALTIYDMCKGIDPEMQIDAIRLLKKSGGKSGTVVME